MVDGSWLPRTARAIAHLLSQVTSREAEATGRALMRLLYSRSSIESAGHAVGSEYLSRREQVESKLIESCELAARNRLRECLRGLRDRPDGRAVATGAAGT